MVKVYAKRMNDNDELQKIREWIIQYSIEDYFNLRLPDLKMKRKNGKPFLKGLKNIQFNISYTEDWIVCAVSETEVGIDIEKIEPVDTLNLADTFFSDKEYELLLNTSPNHRLSLFYEVWTIKESYVKLLGKSLMETLNLFDIHFDSPLHINHKQKSKAFIKQFNIDPSYKLAVCSSLPLFYEDITLL